MTLQTQLISCGYCGDAHATAVLVRDCAEEHEFRTIEDRHNAEVEELEDVVETTDEAPLTVARANVSHPSDTLLNMADFNREALNLLRQLTENPDAAFRDGQLEAIQTVVRDRGRALVVQRTGWGKSAVYFIATRLLRRSGRGPTVIVSPLLALMRNQIEAAERIGIVAETVNSTNRDDWAELFTAIDNDEVDLLLISPERLNNPEFRSDVLPGLLSRLGLLVIDEVHCISDWGHDFRPDYRRLQRIVEALPPSTPVLGTTATANDRVVADVSEQLGSDLAIIRGTLDRPSLRLQVIDMPNKAERMAWLAKTIPDLPGAGIVYALTITDAKRVARFLSAQGVDAEAYTGQSETEDKLRIEERLSSNELKVVVATSALAMGYDNPHVQFVIHFQVPGSPVAYYQQVGRAGRAVDTAYGIALSGEEDVRIQDWFIETAFPPEETTRTILDGLAAADGLKRGELLGMVNMQPSRLDGTLKILEVEQAVYRQPPLWFRSANRWEYPTERIEAVTAQRRLEQQAMAEYVTTGECLMSFLRHELDDDSTPCGRCANCTEPALDPTVDPALTAEAHNFIRMQPIVIEPRKQTPSGLTGITLSTQRLEEGRALTKYGDPGWGDLVKAGKYANSRFDDQLVEASADLIRRWGPDPMPRWMTAVPSRTAGDVVVDFARRLANVLDVEFVEAVTRTADNRPQKEMQNSYQQARNVRDAFSVQVARPESVLLIDDIVDSRWTMTVIGNLLLQEGAGPVFPFAIADAGKG
ncbi:MAG: RecQ family ATP-dependent DNA helicase [Actinomycetota bacterium]|nr:RecQ family ATP-dependent DNA helicase [Actinomycetota bacterium]